VTGKRGKIRKQILITLTKLEGEAVDRTVWRTGFGRGCGPVVRQTRMND
jgi:hypothetical protein